MGVLRGADLTGAASCKRWRKRSNRTTCCGERYEVEVFAFALRRAARRAARRAVHRRTRPLPPIGG
jgi:hypothetical protein